MCTLKACDDGRQAALGAAAPGRGEKFRLEEQNFQQVSQASHSRNDDEGETSVGGEATSAFLMN